MPTTNERKHSILANIAMKILQIVATFQLTDRIKIPNSRDDVKRHSVCAVDYANTCDILADMKY